MEGMIKGITNITHIEGKLERFSKICKLIKPHQRIKRKKLVSLIKDKIGLTNNTVIDRHINVLKKFGIILVIEETIILSSEGKVFYQFINEKADSKKFSLKEKLFYFRLLFTSATEQLVTLLETINENKDKTRKDIIIEYFNKKLVQNVWWRSKNILQKNLAKFEESKSVPEFLEKKFKCMEMWLESLSLLERKNNFLKITNIGEIILAKAKEYNMILNDKIYELTSKLVIKPMDNFDYSKHKSMFLLLLKESYPKFISESNLSDLIAIRSYILVNLLLKNLVLEEKKFNEVLQELWSDGVIRSVIANRKGKPAYIVI